MSPRWRDLAVVVGAVATHEAAAHLLDRLDVAARMLSPSAETGLPAAAATTAFLVWRLVVVFVGPPALFVALVRLAQPVWLARHASRDSR